MWPDRVSNPGHLTYESGALPTALRGPALWKYVPYSLLVSSLEILSYSLLVSSLEI